MSLPIVNLSQLLSEVAPQISAACREHGFFYLTGHGVPDELLAQLDEAAREFFALPEEVKLAIAMEHGGKAWRGFFPVGAELTSGRPDLKEALPDLPLSTGRTIGGRLGSRRAHRPRPAHATRPGRERWSAGEGPARLDRCSAHARNVNAEVPPLPVGAMPGAPRWDGQDLRSFQATCGDYLLAKASKVFPRPRQLT